MSNGFPVPTSFSTAADPKLFAGPLIANYNELSSDVYPANSSSPDEVDGTRELKAPTACPATDGNSPFSLPNQPKSKSPGGSA